MIISSMTTGGGSKLFRIAPGSIIARPLLDGNHNLPSAVRHAAGWQPPESSSVGSPSAKPKTRQSTEFRSPSAHRLKAALFTRKTPA